MSELQPGMLALVVGCRFNQKLIGTVVQIEEAIEKRYPQEDYPSVWDRKGYESGDWVCNASGELWVIASRHLMPIKPEADPLEVTEHQELHA